MHHGSPSFQPLLSTHSNDANPQPDGTTTRDGPDSAVADFCDDDRDSIAEYSEDSTRLRTTYYTAQSGILIHLPYFHIDPPIDRPPFTINTNTTWHRINPTPSPFRFISFSSLIIFIVLCIYIYIFITFIFYFSSLPWRPQFSGLIYIFQLSHFSFLLILYYSTFPSPRAPTQTSRNEPVILFLLNGRLHLHLINFLPNLHRPRHSHHQPYTASMANHLPPFDWRPSIPTRAGPIQAQTCPLQHNVGKFNVNQAPNH